MLKHFFLYGPLDFLNFLKTIIIPFIIWKSKTKQALVSLQMKVKMGMAQRNVLENLK